MNSESLDKVKIIVSALEDKKAEDIRIIDISEISVLADFFVITNGTNKNQVQALADNVEEKLASILKISKVTTVQTGYCLTIMMFWFTSLIKKTANIMIWNGCGVMGKLWKYKIKSLL